MKKHALQTIHTTDHIDNMGRWLSNILVYKCTVICSAIHELIDTGAVPDSWQLATDSPNKA